MTRRQQWKHWQPGGQDPWKHNREVRARKDYRQLVIDTTAAMDALRAMQQAFARWAATRPSFVFPTAAATQRDVAVDRNSTS